MKGARARDGQPNLPRPTEGAVAFAFVCVDGRGSPSRVRIRVLDRIDRSELTFGSASLNCCITVSVAFTWGGAWLDCGPWKRRGGLDQSISVVEIARDGREMGIWGVWIGIIAYHGHASGSRSRRCRQGAAGRARAAHVHTHAESLCPNHPDIGQPGEHQALKLSRTVFLRHVCVS